MIYRRFSIINIVILFVIRFLCSIHLFHLGSVNQVLCVLIPIEYINKLICFCKHINKRSKQILLNLLKRVAKHISFFKAFNFFSDISSPFFLVDDFSDLGSIELYTWFICLFDIVVKFQYKLICLGFFVEPF